MRIEQMRGKKLDFQFSPRQVRRKKALDGAVTATFFSPAGNPLHRHSPSHRENGLGNYR